jgi:hypothetical protein
LAINAMDLKDRLAEIGSGRDRSEMAGGRRAEDGG